MARWTDEPDPWMAPMDAATVLRSRLASEIPDAELRDLAERLLLGSIGGFAALLDLRGHMLAATAAVLRQVGVDRAELTGRPLWRASFWRAPADAAAVHALIAEAAAGHTAQAEVEVEPSNGAAPRKLRMIARPVRTGDGDVAFTIVQSSQSAVLEGASPGATGAQVARQLQELTELRQRLVADLVHDVRAPLMNLAARGQRLASGLDDELRQEGLEIRAAALSTLEQIEELVDLSALQHRRTTLHPADCDLVRTLQTVARGFEAVAARSGVDLVVETPDRLQIRADEHKLTIILGNLVANAVQYAGDQTTVCLAARVEDGELVLEVRDDGTGIAPENLEVVFDRFWRRDFGRRQDGRGLGLTIAREMTELHGGTIEAGVAPEGGARFTARIPYVAPAGASTMPSLQEAAARHLSTEVAVAELQRRLGPDHKPGSRRRRDTRRRA